MRRCSLTPVANVAEQLLSSIRGMSNGRIWLRSYILCVTFGPCVPFSWSRA
jgi:hypothetical protein